MPTSNEHSAMYMLPSASTVYSPMQIGMSGSPPLKPPYTVSHRKMAPMRGLPSFHGSSLRTTSCGVGASLRTVPVGCTASSPPIHARISICPVAVNSTMYPWPPSGCSSASTMPTRMPSGCPGTGARSLTRLSVRTGVGAGGATPPAGGGGTCGTASTSSRFALSFFLPNNPNTVRVLLPYHRTSSPAYDRPAAIAALSPRHCRGRLSMVSTV